MLPPLQLILLHPTDSILEAVLYTSDSDRIMRYADEGDLTKLCRWSVDLAPLPNFQKQVRSIPSGGFYTGKCALAHLRASPETILSWVGVQS
jgi:hypothetical protein